MMQQSEKIYVALDCLLDTRLGTLALLSEEAAVDALKNGGEDYRNRKIDAFDGVSVEEFKALYAKRDVETLKLSLFTNVFTMLQGVVKTSYREAATGSQPPDLTFVINLHPYDLQEEEVAYIVDSVAKRTHESVNVEAVRIPNEFLTPAHCKESYAMMIMYDFVTWFEMHMKAFEKIRMPQVCVTAPEMFAEKLPTAEDLAFFEENKMEPSETTEKLLSPLFCLRLLEARMFSIHDSISPGKITLPGTRDEAVNKEEPEIQLTEPVPDDGFELL